MNQTKIFSPFVLCLLAISLLGTLLFFMATAPWGLGGSSDSASYIAGAESILKGQGYRTYASHRAITQWPPYFSFSLAVMGFFGIPLLEGARFLHTVLFGANIFLVGLFLHKITGSTLTALLGAWLMLTSITMLQTHAVIMPEPWFIFLGSTGLYFLIEYLETGLKNLLFASSVLIALACLDKYAGICLIATGIFAILFLNPKNFQSRLKESVTFMTLTFLPLAAWLARNHFLASDLINQELIISVPTNVYWLELMGTLSSWVAPLPFPQALRYAFFFLVLAMTLFVAGLVIRHGFQEYSFKLFAQDKFLRFISVWVIFMALNSALELAFRIFMDPKSPANDRHLSSIFVAGLMAFLVSTYRFFQIYPNHPIRKTGFVFFLLLGCAYTFGAIPKYRELYQEGGRYTARVWKTSPTVLAVKLLPSDTRIYTNGPTVVYLNTQREAFSFPKKYDRRLAPDFQSAKPSQQYFSRLEKIKQRLISTNGYVVFFDKLVREYTITKNELEQDLPLVPILQLSDGTIYKMNGTKT